MLEVLMEDSDSYLRKFVDFATDQGMVSGLGYGDVGLTTRREELGISSLNIILLVANYMKERVSGDLDFKPEWVAKLNQVDGIIAVLQEIDAACLEGASVK
jgi:hypothetical protein